MKKRVLLIGLGPHAKRIYMQYFKNYDVELSGIVELESKILTTEKYLKENNFNKVKVIGIPDKYKDNKKLPKNEAEKILNFCQIKKIQYIIISTEPKSHYMYLTFALKNNLNVLTDKPITVNKNMTNIFNILSIKRQYYKLLKLYSKSSCKCKVMCQRNYHKGYQYIRDLLKEIVSKYNVPITYVDIYHCDGAWEMIHDLEKENHPYKYGYGKLYHSGFHFIDLLSELIKISNDNVSSDKKMVKGTIYGNIFTPNDEKVIFNKENYQKIFNIDTFDNKLYNQKKFKNYGEKNFYSQLNFYNKNNNLILTSNLNLLHYGFSRRGWFISKDYYKSNGRIRHERVNIQLGTLLNIQIHSYQSKEIKERLNNIDEINTGGLEHFDIDIYRNKDIIGGKAFERIKLYDLHQVEKEQDFLGYNEQSRMDLLNDFFFKDNDIADLKKHKLGIELLYNCTKVYLNKKHHLNKVFKFKFPREKINENN